MLLAADWKHAQLASGLYLALQHVLDRGRGVISHRTAFTTLLFILVYLRIKKEQKSEKKWLPDETEYAILCTLWTMVLGSKKGASQNVYGVRVDCSTIQS